jgi:hypothetical protein
LCSEGEEVGRSVSSCEVFAGKIAGEDGVGQELLKEAVDGPRPAR